MHPRMPIPKPVPQKSSQPASESSPGWPRTRAEFTALVETYADRLVQYAFRQTGNLHDAEDIVQNVFAKAFDGPARSVSAVGPYLYRAVGNACTDFLRRRNRATLFCQEVGMDEVLALAKGPPAAAQAAEELVRIERLLQKLPAEQAEAVRLRVFDELSLQDIAELTECSINTVCSRLRYAFAKLRNALSERQE
jgi:RNA polymerase sigma-70 factor (ECF subfamily)